MSTFVTDVTTLVKETYPSTLSWIDLQRSTIFSAFTFRDEFETATDSGEIHQNGDTNHVSLETTLMEESGGGVSWQWYKVKWEWWTISQLIAALVGILGNLLVMMVVFRRGVRRKSTDILIGTLALADFLTSLFLIPVPQIKQLPATWVGQLYCKIVYINIFMWTFVTVSVYILAVISIERFVAIAYPLRFKTFFSNKLTVLYIIVITIFVTIVQVVWSFVAFVDTDISSCVQRYPSRQLQVDVGIFLFIYKFIIPSSIMLVTQTLTAMSLQAESQRFNETSKDVNASSPQFKLLIAKKRVINMLLLVLLTFVICWGPNQVFFLLLNIGLIPLSLFYGPLYRFLVVLAFLNSCLNPVIYTVRFPRFREALADLFQGSTSSKRQTPIFGQKTMTTATNFSLAIP